MTAPETMPVELVGGPRDGAVVDWPSGMRVLNIATEDWGVRYVYCGQGVDGRLRAQVIREGEDI